MNGTSVASREGERSQAPIARGEWSYRFDLGFAADGQRRQKQVGGFRTKKDAQAALNDALAGVQRGSYVAPSRQTVGEFLDQWVDGVRSERAITAWTNYHDVIGLYVTPNLGGRRLVDLSPMDIKTWHTLLLEHGRNDGTPLATRTVHVAHRVLRRALADAVRWSLIPSNPASTAARPSPESLHVWRRADAAGSS